MTLLRRRPRSKGDSQNDGSGRSHCLRMQVRDLGLFPNQRLPIPTSSYGQISTSKPRSDIGRVFLGRVFPDQVPALEKDVAAVRDAVR